MGGLLGGPKGMLAPLSNYWGGLAPPGPPSSYAYVNIETLIFDRIQNSVLSLRHLPNIKNVFVEHDSSFDKLVMCQHIVGNTQRINLRIGERQSFCEVVSSW